MRKLGVEVLEDASHPEGGYAVILLQGLASLPDGATFRIKPVDAKGTHEPGPGEAWPTGEQRPLAIRPTDAGIELLIGPDIVECPALIPGTLGVIEVGAAGVRGEFLWPSIRPTARPRRRHLAIVRPPAAGRGNSKAAASAAATAGNLPVIQVTASQTPAVQPPAVQTPLAAELPTPRVESGGLATLSTSRLGRDTAKAPAVVVPQATAMDHAAPATASIAEAMGANIVALGSARETVDSDAAAASAGQSAAVQQSTAAAVLAGAASAEGNTRAGRPGNRWSAGRARAAALAASLAIVVSGGFLMLGSWFDIADGTSRPRVEAAPAVVASAEAKPRNPTTREDPKEQIAQPEQGLVEQRRAEPPVPADRSSDNKEAGSRQLAMSQSDGSGSKDAAANDAASAGQPAPPVATAAPAANLEITLKMRGGGFQVSGELKGFDGSKYVIETRSAGVLTMDASRFECVGEACARPAAAILPLSERPSPVKPDVFRIEGAASLAAEFVPQLIKDYAISIGATFNVLPREAGQATRYRIADNRGVELATIEVATSAATPALAALERGSAAIALIDQPLAPEVESRPQPTLKGKVAPVAAPTEILIGHDGIAVMTAPETTPASVSLEVLAKVFAGQITDWYDLGATPGPIQLYLPPDGTGTVETFVRQVLRPRGLELVRTAKRVASDGAAADAVTADPRGLALVSFAAQRGAKPLNLETSCGLIVRPTGFAVKSGEYPLIRRLSMRVPPQIGQPSARGMVRMAQSGDVLNAMLAARILDQSIASLPIAEQSERMAWAANAPAANFDMGELRQMLTDLNGATRLSVTFRFLPGTNDLDQRSRREITRLAAALKGPELAGRRLILGGFTDAGGKFQSNLQVGLKRASQIRSALITAAGQGLDQRLIVAKGYGPLAPVACNGTADGGKLNRRVEVWVAGEAASKAVAR